MIFVIFIILIIGYFNFSDCFLEVKQVKGGQTETPTRSPTARVSSLATPKQRGPSSLTTPLLKVATPRVTSVKKRYKLVKKHRKIRAQTSLFGTSDVLSCALYEYIRCLPEVLRQLEQHDFLQDCMQLLLLIRKGKFPMTNIAFIPIYN